MRPNFDPWYVTRKYLGLLGFSAATATLWVLASVIPPPQQDQYAFLTWTSLVIAMIAFVYWRITREAARGALGEDNQLYRRTFPRWNHPLWDYLPLVVRVVWLITYLLPGIAAAYSLYETVVRQDVTFAALATATQARLLCTIGLYHFVKGSIYMYAVNRCVSEGSRLPTNARAS